MTWRRKIHRADAFAFRTHSPDTHEIASDFVRGG